MATVTYEDVIPTLIENTTMRKLIYDGVWISYNIVPVGGYVLHDKSRDWTEIDEETGNKIAKQGFTGGTVSCPVSYDFTANPREFFVVPRSEICEDSGVLYRQIDVSEDDATESDYQAALGEMGVRL